MLTELCLGDGEEEVLGVNENNFILAIGGGEGVRETLGKVPVCGPREGHVLVRSTGREEDIVVGVKLGRHRICRERILALGLAGSETGDDGRSCNQIKYLFHGFFSLLLFVDNHQRSAG